MLELAGIIILGILAQWVAWRLRVPAILPLILIGLFFGPISTYFTPDGSKWLDPIYGDGGHTQAFSLAKFCIILFLSPSELSFLKEV